MRLAERYPRAVKWLGTQFIATLALLAQLFSQRPDYLVIYGYTQLPQLALCGWALLFNVPFAMAGDANYYTDHVHGWRRILKRWWLCHLVNRAAALIVVGKACRMFWENYGAEPRQIFLAGFAVDNEFFRRECVSQHSVAMQLCKTFDWEEHTVFLYVGRLIKRKNIHHLVTAIQRITERPVALLIAGDGEERASLERLARGNERVRFVGALTQKELPLYYALSDALVLPAREEPWGLVINEAMASGLAVIAHQHCGAALDLVAEDNGIALQGYSIEELTEALRLLAANAVALQQRKEKSQEKIQSWSISLAALRVREAVEATSRQPLCTAIQAAAVSSDWRKTK